jgi:hypothetical protein
MSFYYDEEQPSYQDLLDMLAAQYAMQGGGPQQGFGDPYAPSGGFPSQPMPNGKMPQYRTQGSGFVSDGTVRDYASMALADQDRFSTDAFIQADPRLKPLIARAVAEAGSDPYAAYANFDDPAYRQALVQMAVDDIGYQNQGGGSFDPAKLEGMDGDGDGLVDEGKSWTVEDLIADQGGMTGWAAPTESGFVNPRTGQALQTQSTYADALRERLSGYESSLDNFFNQAAPSTERNLMDIEGVTARLGGMPFPAQGDGGTDYSQSGPGFGGGQNRGAGRGGYIGPADVGGGGYVPGASGLGDSRLDFIKQYVAARLGDKFVRDRARGDQPPQQPKRTTSGSGSRRRDQSTRASFNPQRSGGRWVGGRFVTDR